METRRTIEEVFDIQRGVEILASNFFRQPFDIVTQARNEQERANQEKRTKWLVCSTCGENIRILGGKSPVEILKPGKNFHFAHLHNSKDCPIKTTSKYSREVINRMKYRGIAEGAPHIELKAKLYQGLNLNAVHKGQVSGLQLERVIRSVDENEWRKPDINLVFDKRRVAVELQLSTTWLDVIVGRQEFYRQEGIFILWVFNAFDYKDSSRKLAFSDIIYTNNYNAFVFDEEARDATLSQKDLVLKCYYQHHYAYESSVRSNWESTLVTLDQLTFDISTLKVYFKDIALEKRLAEKTVRTYKETQEKEKLERRRERYRLLGIRAGHEEDYQILKSSVTETEKAIEKLDRRLNEIQRYRDNDQRDLSRSAETAIEIAGNLDNYWKSLPQPVEALRNELIKEEKQYASTIKQLEDRFAKFSAKDNYYRKGRVKRVDGMEYHVLDRNKDWDYILKNAGRLCAYRTDQEKNLFATPELQLLNNHKVQQMRHTALVEFVIDLSKEFSENTLEFDKLKDELKIARVLKAQLDERIPAQLSDAFTRFYKENITGYGNDVQAIKAELATKQSDKRQMDIRKEELSVKIMEMDYLDYTEDEDD